ncbi:MAG: hypothetical protein WDM92_11325 [Caulobacteraceae bacterium]
MPAFMLSGFLFDLRSMPVAVARSPTSCRRDTMWPLLQTVFLAGDIWSVICPTPRCWSAWAACCSC